MKFKVGDRVIVVCPESVNHGSECTITGARIANLESANGKSIRMCFCFSVDLMGTCGCVQAAYEAHQLRLVGDGHELSSWEAIEEITGWHPEAVTSP